jgi:hypothetical protein
MVAKIIMITIRIMAHTQTKQVVGVKWDADGMMGGDGVAIMIGI